MRKTVLCLVAPSLLVAALVVGPATPASAAPTPKAWATKICTAFDGWVKALDKRADTATKKVTRRAGPSKKSLVKMLAGARTDTNKLLSKVKGAGKAKGSDGKQVALNTKEAIAQLGRVLKLTRKDVLKLKPKQLAKFVDQSRRAQDGLENTLERVESIFATTTSFDAKKLLKGFASARSCGKLSDRTTPAMQSPGPNGKVSIASVDPPAGPPGTVTAITFANVDDDGTQKCIDSSAYRVEILGPDGAQIGTGGQAVEIPPDAPVGVSTIRVVCYFPGRYVRPLMRSLCGRFEVTAGAPTAPAGEASAPCPQPGRVLTGESVIAAQRSLGDAFNILVGTIFGR